MAEQYLLDAVEGEAFQLLRDIVIKSCRERGMEEGNGEEHVEDALLKLATRLDQSNKESMLGQIQDLVDSLAAKRPFLRILRNKEEDTAVRRSQSSRPPANYQAYLSLVAVIYRHLPPDSAQYLWDNTTFTGAVLDSRGAWSGPALWDMLSAISSGSLCASKAFERIKDTRFQFSLLFKFYQHRCDIMPHLYDPIKSSRTASLDSMSAEDVEICKGWTSVLATVVRSSPLARSALLQSKPHPLQMLFDFVNCDIPLELKATIFEAITAFCVRTSERTDDDVLSRAVESYERISYTDGGLDARYLDASRVPAPIGWIAKMEYSEQDLNTYPLTRAYIRFLTTLLPAPASASDLPPSSRPRLTNTLRRGTAYILDRVLLSPNPRRYARDCERWDMLADISTFIEQALLGFNMGELLTQVNSRAIGQIAVSLSEEAGFSILLRLLSETNIFNVLAGIVDQAGNAPLPRLPRVNDALLSVLRIYHRILDIQLVFSDFLLLTLSDPTRTSSAAFRRPIGLQSLDQHLLVHLSNVTAIAVLIGDDNLEVSLISTKIMSALAASPIFSRSDVFRGEYSTSVNRLAGIIDASDDSILIAQGFCRRMEGDGTDIEPQQSTEIADAVCKGTLNPRIIESLPLVIRSAILDLLIEGTSQDAAGPNLAHFLLGFDFKGSDFGLKDPRSSESRVSCLHVLLDQLDRGADNGASSSIRLVSLHPVLAAKSAQSIYQLFSHSFTARSSMSYAVSVAGFSTRQLAALPRLCPSTSDQSGTGRGFATVSDFEVATSADTLVAFLEFQRWILSSVALEAFAYDGNGASASQLAASLFQDTIDEEVQEDEVLQGKRPPLIIDILSSVDTQWREELPDVVGENRPLEFYGTFDFDQYKRPDAEWWNLTSLERGLQAFRRHLERNGAVTAGTSTKAIEAEGDYIVQRLGTRNRETEISIAKGNFLTAWNEALKVSLALLFQHVSDETQELVLFELLDALLDRLDTNQPPGVLEIICESVLVSMTSLIHVLMDFEGINLPVDRLGSILRKVIDAVVRPNTIENARGNLYAAITQYFQLLTVSTSIADEASVVASTIGRESVLQSDSSGFQRATIQVIESKKDRLLAAVCRDAMDDRDVWKTECFTLLGGLAAICHSERDRQILSPLMKDGFLPAFVRSIKDREIALQECLSPGSRTSNDQRF